jgi:hypothetical protein
MPLDELRAQCKANAKKFSFKETRFKADLPMVVDHRDKCGETYDQGQLGSCTSNSYCGNCRAVGLQKDPSRLFHYVTNRLGVSGKVEDLGADLSQSKASTIGVCDEQFWPYTMDKGRVVNFPKIPNKSAYDNAKKKHSSRNVKFNKCRLG